MSVQLYQGDCLEIMRGLSDGSVDAVITDPPYSSGVRHENQKGLRKSMIRGTEDEEWFSTDCLTGNAFAWFMRSCAVEWRRLLKNGGHALVFIDWRMLPNLAAAIESADLRHIDVLVWNKTYFGMGQHFRKQHEFVLQFTSGKPRAAERHDIANVLSHKPIRGGIHPTEKPVGLLRELLTVVSARGDVVLDPFMGSGTTGLAARQEGRSFIGIEREPRYFAIAQERLAREEVAA